MNIFLLYFCTTLSQTSSIQLDSGLDCSKANPGQWSLSTAMAFLLLWQGSGSMEANEWYQFLLNDLFVPVPALGRHERGMVRCCMMGVGSSGDVMTLLMQKMDVFITNQRMCHAPEKEQSIRKGVRMP